MIHREESLACTAQIPKSGGMVVAGRDDALAVRAKTCRKNRRGVLQPRCRRLTGGGEPQAGGSVRTGRDHEPAIRTERSIHDWTCVPDGGADRRARGRVPYPGGAILTRCQQPTSIRAEASSADPALMANQRYDVASGRVEDPGSAIATRDGNAAGIRAELAIASASVLCHPKPCDQFTRRNAPNGNHGRGRNEAASIRAKRNPCNRRLVFHRLT